MTAPKAHVLWLLRHGEREDFVDLDWGKTAERPQDPGLSPHGVAQAEAAGTRLAGEEITRIFSSPYLRCAQTAHLVAERARAPIHIEPGLGELNHPDWSQGAPTLLSTDALARATAAFDPEHQMIHQPAWPETMEEAFARAELTVRTLAERYEGRLLLVGHAVSIIGTMRALGAQEDVHCPPASLHCLVRDGDAWKATLVGGTTHLVDVK